jgi:hypothetical protein
MITAVLGNLKGHRMLIIGLTDQDVAKLHAGYPVVLKPMAEEGPFVRCLLVYGKTSAEIRNVLEATARRVAAEMGLDEVRLEDHRN